jgi:ATP-dependent exoDNAse (exonuclease V) beta subunit
MDMNFIDVQFDLDVDEAEADELRGLVREFVKAQDENHAEFAEAVETVDELSGKVGEIQEYEEELTEELTEVSPLSDEEVAAFSLQRKRDLLAEFSVEEEVEEEVEGEGDDTPTDFGQSGPTHGDDEAVPEFVQRVYADIDGMYLPE